MHSATRAIVSIIAIYAAFLGILHGYFEINQGDVSPDGLVIEAIGDSCDPETEFHACWPAMTLVRNFQISGMLAFLVASAILVWSMAFVEQKNGSLVLFVLSLLLLLVGGGFLPPLYGMLAAAVSTRINRPLTWWETRIPANRRQTLAAIWPCPIVIYLMWAGTVLIFGEGMNESLRQIGAILTPLEIIVLLIAVMSAFAFDIQKQNGNI